MLSLPPTPAAGAAAPIAQAEVDATLAALKPSKRERPLVAIIGINDATETTDYLLPYGILRRAGVVDIVALAAAPGPMALYPALKVVPDATVAEFDAHHPEGADYVVVPAMSHDDDPTVLRWLKDQAAKGAIVIGICAGAKVVAAAGLLNGRRATTHWYYLQEMLGAHPRILYVPDRRFVVDRGVATTTGITASIPLMLTLIEAISGREQAAVVASELGVSTWDARHHSEAFKLTWDFAFTVLANAASPWTHETLGLALEPGIDEVSIALIADAWSRTYRSRAISFAAVQEPVRSRSGMRLLPDEVRPHWERTQLLAPTSPPPAAALDEALSRIAERYGQNTAKIVAMQLEYPGFPSRQTAAGSP